MLQCFGAARELDLLKVFQPAYTTQRVAKEQHRTAPPHARTQFQQATAQGSWLSIHQPAANQDIQAVTNENSALSQTDAELFVLARASADDLFTDETKLHGFATARGVTAYNVTGTILLLEELGTIDAKRKKKIVFDIHAEDGRVFKPRELDALNLKGLF